MLTPTATDPNREQELARQKKDPTAFGTESIVATPTDWNPAGGLKEDAPKAEAKKSKKLD